MRILSRELKKLFKPNLVIILLLFSAIYIWIFSNAVNFPNNYVDSKYDVPMYRDLVERFGTEIDEEEWQQLEEIKQELTDEITPYILEDKVFADAGINSYEKFDEIHSKFSSELKDTEKAASEETTQFWFFNETTSELLFRLQCVNNILRVKDLNYVFADEKTAETLIPEDAAEIHKKRLTEIFAYKDYSLIPNAAANVLFDDEKILIILGAIWCFILILPYQISERLCGTIPITVSTKTGKSFFSKQAAACAVSGGVIFVFLSAAYTFLLYKKGVLFFADCPMSTHIIPLWFDITLFQYYLAQCAVLLTVIISSSLIAYIIGRISTSYIMGLAIAIPSAALICFVSSISTYMMFYVNGHTNNLFLEAFGKPLAGIVGILILTLAGVIIKLKKDKVSDVL